MLPATLTSELPPEIRPDRVRGWVRVGSSFDSIMGETYLMDHDRKLVVLTRESILQPYQVYYPSEPIELEASGFEHVAWVAGDGKRFKLRVGYGEVDDLRAFLEHVARIDADGAERTSPPDSSLAPAPGAAPVSTLPELPASGVGESAVRVSDLPELPASGVGESAVPVSEVPELPASGVGESAVSASTVSGAPSPGVQAPADPGGRWFQPFAPRPVEEPALDRPSAAAVPGPDDGGEGNATPEAPAEAAAEAVGDSADRDSLPRDPGTESAEARFFGGRLGTAWRARATTVGARTRKLAERYKLDQAAARLGKKVDGVLGDFAEKLEAGQRRSGRGSAGGRSGGGAPPASGSPLPEAEPRFVKPLGNGSRVILAVLAMLNPKKSQNELMMYLPLAKFILFLAFLWFVVSFFSIC